jgi:hypothetical protein
LTISFWLRHHIERVWRRVIWNSQRPSAVGVFNTYALQRRHRQEASPATKGVCAAPCPWPLRLLGLDALFESTAIVTFSVEQSDVSRLSPMAALHLCDRTPDDLGLWWSYTDSTGFLRLSTRPSRAQSKPSTSAEGVSSAAPNSRSWGPRCGAPRGKASLNRERNMTMNYGTRLLAGH